MWFPSPPTTVKLEQNTMELRAHLQQLRDTHGRTAHGIASIVVERRPANFKRELYVKRVNEVLNTETNYAVLSTKETVARERKRMLC